MTFPKCPQHLDRQSLLFTTCPKTRESGDHYSKHHSWRGRASSGRRRAESTSEDRRAASQVAETPRGSGYLRMAGRRPRAAKGKIEKSDGRFDLSGQAGFAVGKTPSRRRNVSAGSTLSNTPSRARRMISAVMGTPRHKNLARVSNYRLRCGRGSDLFIFLGKWNGMSETRTSFMTGRAMECGMCPNHSVRRANSKWCGRSRLTRRCSSMWGHIFVDKVHGRVDHISIRCGRTDNRPPRPRPPTEHPRGSVGCNPCAGQSVRSRPNNEASYPSCYPPSTLRAPRLVIDREFGSVKTRRALSPLCRDSGSTVV